MAGHSLGVLCAAQRKIHCSVAVIWLQVSGLHSACSRTASPFSSMQNCRRCSYFHTPSSWVSGADRMCSTSKQSRFVPSTARWCYKHCTLGILPDGLLDVLLYCQSGVHLIKRLLWPFTKVARFCSWQISPDNCVASLGHLGNHFLSATKYI